MHEVYNTLNSDELVLVNSTARQVMRCFTAAGYEVPGDDRAERMVEALSVFLKTCTKK